MTLNSIIQVYFSNHIVKKEQFLLLWTIYKILVYFPKDNTSNTKFYMETDKSIQRNDYKIVQQY